MAKQHSVWHNGREYVWNTKYADFVCWFRTSSGQVVGERYSDVLARESPEESAQAIGNAHESLLDLYRTLKPEEQDENVLAEMLERERNYRPILEQLGRRIIVDDGREPDVVLLGDNIPRDFQRKKLLERVASPKYEKYIIVELRVTPDAPVKQRRFFTLAGEILQDVDHQHQKEEGHFFPHIHLYRVDPKKHRSLMIRFIDQLLRIPYSKGSKMAKLDLYKYKEQASDSGVEWRKRNGYTYDDLARFDDPTTDMSSMTLDELLLFLSHGHEMEVEYNGWEGFVTPNGIFGYRAVSGNGEQKKEYESIDIEEFADNAVIGPYYIKDIIGKWTVTAIF